MNSFGVTKKYQKEYETVFAKLHFIVSVNIFDEKFNRSKRIRASENFADFLPDPFIRNLCSCFTY